MHLDIDRCQEVRRRWQQRAEWRPSLGSAASSVSPSSMSSSSACSTPEVAASPPFYPAQLPPTISTDASHIRASHIEAWEHSGSGGLNTDMHHEGDVVEMGGVHA